MLSIGLIVVALCATKLAVGMSSHPFLKDLPTLQEIQERVDQRFDELFTRTNDGFCPVVCGVCDEFIRHRDDICLLTEKKLKKCHGLLKWTSTCSILPDQGIVDEYKFKGQWWNGDPPSYLLELALSPRSVVYQKGNRKERGIACCLSCHGSLMRKKLPFYAIVNNNYVGCAPACLRDLTEVELAFLTPCSSYGYCFSYTGGKQMQLKGTLAFMRVKERAIAKSVTALDLMGLNNNVVVLTRGTMTKEQKKKMREKTTIRVEKMITALKWLVVHHQSWGHIKLNEVEKEVRGCNVLVIEHDVEVQSTNVAIESQEIFTCYFPEGTATTTNGGYKSPEEFKEFARELQKNNYEVELSSNLQKDFVKDGNSDILIATCLLQFPYGICGLDSPRQKADGSTIETVNVEDFMCHLSKKSDVCFQTPLMQLIMYSIVTRDRLLKMSRLQVKGEKTASDLANGVNYRDVEQAIHQRRIGNNYGGTQVSNKLLDSVEACTGSIPHTNEAAKKARTTGESMQHYFGTGCIFLTATFDDDNNVLMQVLSGIEVDTGEDISTLSDNELEERCKSRRGIRLRFPGVASLHFEILLDILFEEVLGWSKRKNQSTGKPGFFGICDGVTMAIEEQARLTLHGHLTAWIRGYRELQDACYSGTDYERTLARQALQKYYERLSTTEFFGNARGHDLKKAWNHECKVPLRERRPASRARVAGLQLT